MLNSRLLLSISQTLKQRITFNLIELYPISKHENILNTRTALLKCGKLLLSNRQQGISTSVRSCQEMDFAKNKDKYLKLSLEEKRSQYQCKSKYVPLDKISPWNEYALNIKALRSSPVYSKNEKLNQKVSIFVADITVLEIDAIVNAANTTLRGGGGVDGAIHRAAGNSLLGECITLHGCPTGEAKITGGYKLPAKYVIHAVGPIGENPEMLQNCYVNSLAIAKENELRSIAFPCISTGIYGYPNEKAAHVALKTVREFLEKNEASMDRVIFCLFLPVDVGIYESLMQQYFPV